MAAPLVASLVGVPNLTDLGLLPNHRRYVPQWNELMKADHTFLQRAVDSAWAAAEYIVSFQKGKVAA